MYSETLNNSNAVAIGGFPEALWFGFFTTNFLFHSSLYDLLARGFEITIFHVGAKNAATGSSFSKGHVSLNLAEIPHIKPFKIKPFHSLFLL